jgi:2-oxoisovalerate dehydrogenase E1 component alpha subunit
MANDSRSQIRREVLESVKVAENAKKPPIRDLFTDVYAELSEESKDQMRELRDILERYESEYDIESHEGGIGSLKDV